MAEPSLISDLSIRHQSKKHKNTKIEPFQPDCSELNTIVVSDKVRKCEFCFSIIWFFYVFCRSHIVVVQKPR